jgi:RES domain-containing protein
MTKRSELGATFAETLFFAGPASLAGPASSGLTNEAMVTTEGNRWSSAGEPTIYLAGDLGVALAEFGRHVEQSGIERAHVWPVRVELDAVMDLRSAAARAYLDLPRGRTWPLKRERCADLAGRLRETGEFEAVIVPTVAMLDRAERWNLVVFVDRLRRPPAAALRPGAVAMTVGPR